MSSVLTDWLGAGGKPVPQDHAEGRAAVCVGCPENRAPKWWEIVKSAIAETIRLHLSLKHEMNIRVSTEERLGMCKVCGCAIPLKVHVPIEHIAENTGGDVKERFPNHCWIHNELYELQHR